MEDDDLNFTNIKVWLINFFSSKSWTLKIRKILKPYKILRPFLCIYARYVTLQNGIGFKVRTLVKSMLFYRKEKKIYGSLFFYIIYGKVLNKNVLVRWSANVIFSGNFWIEAKYRNPYCQTKTCNFLLFTTLTLWTDIDLISCIFSWKQYLLFLFHNFEK